MKLVVRHAGGELVVPTQSEFLVLYQRGVIAPEDLVQRVSSSKAAAANDEEAKWIRADELPWIRGTAIDAKQDGRRLFGLTLVLMILGLLGVVYIQARAAKNARPVASAPASSSK